MRRSARRPAASSSPVVVVVSSPTAPQSSTEQQQQQRQPFTSAPSAACASPSPQLPSSFQGRHGGRPSRHRNTAKDGSSRPSGGGGSGLPASPTATATRHRSPAASCEKGRRRNASRGQRAVKLRPQERDVVLSESIAAPASPTVAPRDRVVGSVVGEMSSSTPPPAAAAAATAAVVVHQRDETGTKRRGRVGGGGGGVTGAVKRGNDTRLKKRNKSSNATASVRAALQGEEGSASSGCGSNARRGGRAGGGAEALPLPSSRSDSPASRVDGAPESVVVRQSEELRHGVTTAVAVAVHAKGATRRTAKQLPAGLKARTAVSTLHNRNKNRNGVTATLSITNAGERTELTIPAACNDLKEHRLPSRRHFNAAVSASDVARVEGGVLEQVLHDPAVVAQLPPDPCVVKVVSSSVSDGPHDGALSLPPPQQQQQQQRVMVSVLDAVVAADEEARLSRRGLRFEAVPWSPTGFFAVTPAELPTQSSALALPAVSAAGAPVTAALSFAPATVVVVAPPSVTITSTLVDVGDATRAAAATAEEPVPLACPLTPPSTGGPPISSGDDGAFTIPPTHPLDAALESDGTSPELRGRPVVDSSPSPSPSSSAVREVDRESGERTPVLTSPPLGHQQQYTTAPKSIVAAVGPERPATAPALRRSIMTVTNTATGARLSSSFLATPSSALRGPWGVGAEGTSRLDAQGVTRSNSGSGTTGAAGGFGASRAVPAVRSAESPQFSGLEFPAMPVPPSGTHAASTAATVSPPPPLPQHQQRHSHSLSSSGVSGSAPNPAEPSSATATAANVGGVAEGSHSSPTAAGAYPSGGSSHSGSPHRSLHNGSSIQSSHPHFPHNSSSTAVNAVHPSGGDAIAASSSLLVQSSSCMGFSSPMQRESYLDRVRHNRVAVSDMAAKDETTLVDTLFADADMVEDDESEMDVDDGRCSTAGSDHWPAYHMGTSPESYTSAYVKQQQRVFRVASPTVAGVGPSFGGGYWYQSGSGGGGSRSRFSPDNGVHRAVSASCASVASSTMSLLDPRQPAADHGAKAYEVGEDEEEWEMNSSAYADSLDEAQILWIEEQLKATENPAGYF